MVLTVNRERPTYDLAVIQRLVGRPESRVITGVAFNGAGELGLDESAIIACVQSLDASSFCKTMPAEKRPGSWQDVYRPSFAGFPLYVKVQIVGDHPDELAVVISFKRR